MFEQLRINGVAKIQKCVAEFVIWELNISPYAKFKIKIYEDQDNQFTGYTNIQVKDSIGDFYCAVGYGKTIEDALDDTIKYFFKLTAAKNDWSEEDFEWADPIDF